MKKFGIFQAEIEDWVRSFGVRCAALRPENSLFDNLVIENGTGLLTLVLIDLPTWRARLSEASRLLISIGHQQEMMLATKTGRCVVIWEDSWQFAQDIVKSRLGALLGFSERIPARLTMVRRIDKRTASAFLASNHLQGNTISKTQYGLFLPEKYYRVLLPASKVKAPENEWLVAVATFSHARVFYRGSMPYRSFEMIRFANVLHTTVVGGLARLIKAFAREFHPGDIMTYADLEWSDGNSYKQLGFEAVSDIPPVDFWLDPQAGIRYSTRKPGVDEEGKIRLSNIGSRKFVLSLHEDKLPVKRG